MSNLKVCILGTGFSAGYCYRATQKFPNIDVTIFGVQAPTQMVPQGAFWLREVPECCNSVEMQVILIEGIGDAKTYVDKQWGEDISVTEYSSSFPEVSYRDYGVNPAELVKPLWKGASIVLLGEPIAEARIMTTVADNTVIFMTFPTEESKETNKLLRFPVVTYDDFRYTQANVVTYNGDPGPVVRMSKLFGKIYVEYQHGYILDMNIVGAGGEVSRAMDMHPDTKKWDPERVIAPNVHLLGRYAQWDRHKLAHEAYNDTIEILEKYV